MEIFVEAGSRVYKMNHTNTNAEIIEMQKVLRYFCAFDFGRRETEQNENGCVRVRRRRRRTQLLFIFVTRSKLCLLFCFCRFEIMNRYVNIFNDAKTQSKCEMCVVLNITAEMTHGIVR